MTSSSTRTRERYHHGDLPAALLERSLHVLRDGGAGKLSLRGLARDLGVDAASVYRHFRDKPAFLRAVAREGFDRMGAFTDSQMERADGAEERLRALGRAYVGFARQEPALFRLMFGPSGAGSPEPLPPTDGVSLYTVLEKTLSALAEEAGAEVSVDTVRAAWAVVHGFAGLVLDGLIPETEADNSLEVALDVVVRGITPPART